jgi:hypothetical protein
VAISVDTEQDLDNLLARLEAVGYGRRQLLMRMAPTLRLGWRLFLNTLRGYEVPIDLLTSSSGIEHEVIAAAISVEILPSLNVPVASRAHLIAMKVVSEDQGERIRDRIDLQGLLAMATDSELGDVRRALTLIQARGFDRGKDLLLAFNQLLELFGPGRVQRQ